ncbi:MAG: hypothetical protein ACI4CC_06600 [Lachnospiraceae bacterium]
MATKKKEFFKLDKKLIGEKRRFVRMTQGAKLYSRACEKNSVKT